MNRRCSLKNNFADVLLTTSQNLQEKPVSKPLFNKVANSVCNFVKNRLQHSKDLKFCKDFATTFCRTVPGGFW